MRASALCDSQDEGGPACLQRCLDTGSHELHGLSHLSRNDHSRAARALDMLLMMRVLLLLTAV